MAALNLLDWIADTSSRHWREIDLGLLAERRPSASFRASPHSKWAMCCNYQPINAATPLLTPDGITVGRFSQNFKPPTNLRCIAARVHAIVVWRQRDSSAEYAVDRCRCERWEVVVPELVLATD